jgi:hypothetical protein
MNRLIITAASSEYGPSLLALLGSLNLHWPDHPPILVYDIGLDDSTLLKLSEHKISVKKVPAFCPHWRDHYTWKIWCLNDAPAQNILWMDAGLVVLQPLEEIFLAIETQGYFVVTNYELLDQEASEEACEGCGVPITFRMGKLSLAAGLMGFKKTGIALKVLQKALSVALVERFIISSSYTHRWEQAIISLLMYKYYHNIIYSDGIVYLGWLSPQQSPAQKVWAHRRSLRKQDSDYLIAHISEPGDSYPLKPSFSFERIQGIAYLYKVFWYYVLNDRTEAEYFLKLAFRIDPSLYNNIDYIAGWIKTSQDKLENIPARQEFKNWCINNIPYKLFFRARLSALLYAQESYRCYQTHDLKRTRFNIVLCCLNWPFWIFNRGFLIMLMETIIGTQMITNLRQLKKIL